MTRFYARREPRLRERAADDVDTQQDTVPLAEAEHFVEERTARLLRDLPREAHAFALPCGVGKTQAARQTIPRTYLAFGRASWPMVTVRGGRRRRARGAFLTDTIEKAQEVLLDLLAAGMPEGSVEVLQSIGRARACRSAHTVRVFALSCDPVPGLHVGQLTTVAEFCPSMPTPQELDALRERNDRVQQETARRIEGAMTTFGEEVPSVGQLQRAAGITRRNSVRALAGVDRKLRPLPEARARAAAEAFLVGYGRAPSSRELQALARCRRDVVLDVLRQVVPTSSHGFSICTSTDTRGNHPEPPWEPPTRPP